MLQILRNQLQHQLSPAADPTRQWVASIGLAAAVGVAYFLAARLSLALLVDGVAVFWPAAGVAAGVLIALGPRARLSVAVGTMAATIVANLLGDRNLSSTIVFALSNAGEAVLAAWLIERYFGSGLQPRQAEPRARIGGGGDHRDRRLGDRRDRGVQVVPRLNGADMDVMWQHWIASDGLGIITVAPLVIGLAAAARERAVAERAHRRCCGGSGAGADRADLSFPCRRSSWRRLCRSPCLFPPLLWLAARCRPVFVAAGGVHRQPYDRLGDDLRRRSVR